MADILNYSVGRNGKNRADDVRNVQTLLNLVPVSSLYGRVPNHGIPDLNTQKAIDFFQREIMKMAIPDGRIDPKGQTISALYGIATSHARSNGIVSVNLLHVMARHGAANPSPVRKIPHHTVVASQQATKNSKLGNRTTEPVPDWVYKITFDLVYISQSSKGLKSIGKLWILAKPVTYQTAIILSSENASELQGRSYTANSGSSRSYYSLPEGVWSCENRVENREPNGRYHAGMNREGVGFSVLLDQKYPKIDPNKGTHRTLIEIHPDGNLPGTAGCIGLTGNKQELLDCRSRLKSLLQGGTHYLYARIIA